MRARSRLRVPRLGKLRHWYGDTEGHRHLDEVQLDQIRALVQARTAPSVSGFVQHAVAVALDDVAGWGAMLAEALRQTGGPLSDDERAWADDVLGTSTEPAA
jgi:hypothetical protein